MNRLSGVISAIQIRNTRGLRVMFISSVAPNGRSPRKWAKSPTHSPYYYTTAQCVRRLRRREADEAFFETEPDMTPRCLIHTLTYFCGARDFCCWPLTTGSFSGRQKFNPKSHSPVGQSVNPWRCVAGGRVRGGCLSLISPGCCGLEAGWSAAFPRAPSCLGWGPLPLPTTHFSPLKRGDMVLRGELEVETARSRLRTRPSPSLVLPEARKVAQGL